MKNAENSKLRQTLVNNVNFSALATHDKGNFVKNHKLVLYVLCNTNVKLPFMMYYELFKSKPKWNDAYSEVLSNHTNEATFNNQIIEVYINNLNVMKSITK